MKSERLRISSFGPMVNPGLSEFQMLIKTWTLKGAVDGIAFKISRNANEMTSG